MPAFSTISLLPLLLLGASEADRGPGGQTRSRQQPIQLAQLSIEQRVIIRIPTMPPRSAPDAAPAAPLRWNESRGPRCLPLNLIRAAVVTNEAGVTMVVSRTERYLAHVGRACRAADFYAGFYISPNKDGVLCAGRDTLHARNGSACDIERFTRLTAQVVQTDPDEATSDQNERSPR